MLIACLGNPGREYERSRHNAGFLVGERLAARHGLGAPRTKWRALVQEGRLGPGGPRVVIVRPQTYMNLSGDAVGPAMRFFGYEPADVLAVHDELDLPFGTVRIKDGGGLAGHNGLKSLRAHLGTDAFPRVRVGIGRPAPGFRGDVADWVLRPFTEPPVEVDLVAELAADLVEAVVTDGVATAMNRHNAD